MSRAQATILTNICLIEDLENKRVVMQYRSPKNNRWSGYAFPGGHVENSDFRPLSELTDGIHYHLVEAETQQDLHYIEEALDQLGYLVKD